MSRSNGNGRSRYRDGDTPFIGMLYSRLGEAVFALLLKGLRSREQARDASQEVWLKISRAVGTGTVPEFPVAWVFTIARRTLIDFARRRNGSPAQLVAETAAAECENEAERRERKQWVHDALKTLTHREHELIDLRHFQGLRIREISRRLGIPQTTTRNNLASARRRLSVILKQNPPRP